MEERVSIDRCLKEYDKAKGLIPDGVKGMHKIYSVEHYPAYFTKGKGCFVYDLDSNEYIDFVMGKGPYILGYAQEEVDGKVVEQIKLGCLFPIANTLHNQVAKQIIDKIPSVEQVLFYKTGSCATTAAIRIARIYTGRKMILSSGYHGWHDWCNSGDDIVDGVSEAFYDFEYDLNVLDRLMLEKKDQIAAVIVTPEEYYFSKEFYQYIQKKCHENQILFILDEVKSGFRVSEGGFQKKNELNIDLTCFSKAISNGYSMSVVGGKKEIMECSKKIHTAGTYDTEVTSFAAANEVLKLIEEKDVANVIEERGQYFSKKLNELFEKYDIALYSVFATGSFRFWTDYNEVEDLFYREMAKSGVLFYANDNSYISFAHTKEVLNETLSRVEHVLLNWQGPKGRNHEQFKLEYVDKDFKNKKGFLKNYSGVNGRG